MELSFNKIDDLRRLVSERLINLDFQQIGDRPFHSSIKSIVASPEIRATRWSHSPGHTFRDQGLIKDGDESISLVYPVNCRINVAHLDREQRLTPEHSVIVRHDRIGQIGSPQQSRFVALLVPPATPAHAALTHFGVFAKRIAGDASALKLLKSYVSLLASRADLMQGEVAASAGRHIADLIAIAAAQLSARTAEHAGDTIAEARLQVTLAFMARCFHSRSISVAAAAAAQNISARYLHRLLEQAGIRFTDHVNELRLQAACESLVENAAKPISAIALESGFSDISHFNRLFRKRFGATPSAIRSRR